MSHSFGVGTPPTNRGVSPAPRKRVSGDQRNSVVPFTRPNSSVDNQNSSFERSFRASAPRQSQSQPVLARPSFSKFSLDKQAPQHGLSSGSFSLPSKPADSPFSRQEGFAASISQGLAERSSQAVLASPLESPGRTKSTSLLSQQLNREASVSLMPIDVKVCTSRASTLLAWQHVVYDGLLTLCCCCRNLWRPAMICRLLYLQASKLPSVWKICR